MNDNACRATVNAAAATGPWPRTARAVSLLHTGVILIFTLGWLAPWSFVHWLVLGGGILMQLSWTLFDNDCPLTLLERRLAGDSDPERDRSPDGPRNFVSRLLSRIVRRTVSDRTGDIVTYAVLFSSMLICTSRLAF